MTDQKNAAQAGASVSFEPAPLDLHSLYQQQAACGYTRDLVLHATQVQSLNASLRGINAVVAVLVAADDAEQIGISDWMRSGLTEAIRALSWGMTKELESANEHAREKGGAA